MADEVLALKLPSPEYDTVMVCVPTDKPDVRKLAVPPDSVRLPMLTPPSLNVTVPVGVPTPGDTADTVAVKVTAWPNTVGLMSDTTVVLVAALLTVCNRSLELLALKLPSPEYETVMVCVPTDSDAVEKLAAP